MSRPIVFLVANTCWNIWNYRMPVMEALLDAGCAVRVLAPADETLPLVAALPVDVVHLKHFNRNNTSPVAFVRALNELAAHYRRHRPAVVLHFGIQANIVGTLAARMARVQAVQVVTGLGYTFLHGGLHNRLVRALQGFTSRLAARVVFENAADRELLLARGMVRRARTAVVSGCGIHAHRYIPTGPPSGRSIVFAYFGRLLYDKGLREFYEAARMVQAAGIDAVFCIYGPMDRRNPAHVRPAELLRWIKSRVVRYRGPVSDVRPYMQAADVVVMPSYREGLSRTLLEAMALARPVIATDVPGCREAVDHMETGLLVPPGDAAALAEAMLYICGVPADTRRAMGTAGRQKVVQGFSGVAVGVQYLDVLRPLLPETDIDDRNTHFAQIKNRFI